MITLNDLHPAKGSTHKSKRLGQGIGSGHGKTSGKGNKGDKSRTGGGVRPGFEGGQLPLYRKLPKRGFNNKFAVHYATVNVAALNRYEDGAVIDAETLLRDRVIRKEYDGVKILGNGTLSKKVTVKASSFSASAKEKIEAAGGQTEEV